jgi:YHS domain-containing protein
MNRWIALMSIPATLVIAGCSHSADKSAMSSHDSGTAAMSSTQTPSRQAAVDLHNTVCPVSGDQVESSPLTETYDGKIYHLCCKDCVKPFRSEPAKYAQAVADNPTKYGVTGQK